MRAFVGPSESLLSIYRFSGRFSSSSFESKLPYSVTVGGLAVNINMSSSTFELDINLYLSAIYDKPSLTSSTPIRCVFDDSPRWKNHKPMPYNSRQGFVVVTGNLTGFILSKADASGHQSIERFILTIRDVYFMGVVPPKKNQPLNQALTNTLDCELSFVVFLFSL